MDIGTRGPTMHLSLRGINGQNVISNCKKIDLNIMGTFGKMTLRGAVSISNLDLPSQVISQNFLDNLNSIAKDKLIKPYYNPSVEILIGQDNWHLIATRELISIPKTQLAISRCALGWTLHGSTSPISRPKRTNKTTAKLYFTSGTSAIQKIDEYDSSLNDLIRYYFNLESIGVSDNIIRKNKQDRAEKILEKTCRCIGKSWEVGLLWKTDQPPLTDGKLTAKKRLLSLEKRLDRDPRYAELYYKEMRRFIDLGYAKIVQNDTDCLRTWYLPHFGVVNANKPDKIRLVFDAAAKTSGISLNDQLDTGPDLLKSLPGIFIRFRQYAIAVKGDIADMFLRVCVQKNDRGAQRFLWRERDRQNVPRVYEMTCLIFGAKSSPSSAIFVKNKNAKMCENSLPEASRSIINNSYMDDFLCSCRSEIEASRLVKNVIEINGRANFLMHGWASNAAAVLPNATHEETVEDHETRLCDKENERVLGLYWDTQSDILKFNIELKKIPREIIRGHRKPTKRDVLRVVMSIFDPLGLTAPFTLKSKIIMQRIWQSGIKWDETVRDEEYANWINWLKELETLKEWRIPRCLTPTNYRNKSAQLHVFCDASLTAFAAAAYLRIEISASQSYVALIMAKGRIAPLKPTTIPRLELQAALLGARLMNFVQKELEINIEKRVLWTDSTIVLCWIRNEPRSHQIYVANRLGEIAELTNSSEWRWVPSVQNAADNATRFENTAFKNSSQWFSGPEFLALAEDHWPKEKVLSKKEANQITSLETRKAFVFTASTTDSIFSLSTRLLGWQGLIIIARRVKKFFDRWRRKVNINTPTQDLLASERYWIRVIQAECFQAELQTIIKNKKLPKNSKIASLMPFLDKDNILRAKGRASLVNDENFNNTPIILDGKRMGTKKLISEYHRKYYHGSKETVINEIRQIYYIVGLRNSLKSLISRCITCRIRRRKPRSPLMAALPACRVASRERPFAHCGMDYFGPMIIKIGRRQEKRWGVLMTCLTTRAIHLELANSLTSSSAIMALQRLAARRGMPLVVYSDNGTNFRGASKELTDAIKQIDDNEMQRFAVKRKIEWRFNPPDAPHMGGAWERLIRSVKIALKAVLNAQTPSEELLHTIMTEVEHSVNSRPLTHVSLDPRDNEALTPNHFLIGSSSGNIKLGKYELKNVCLRSQWKLAQAYADAFWKRWLREYLPTIMPRKKWRDNDAPLEVGDIVLIVDLQAPRNLWTKGQVIKVFPARIMKFV